MSSQHNGQTPTLAPHSVEAEEAVLGAILLNPDAFFELAQFLTEDSFFILRNAWVWQSMERIIERGGVIDNLTVIDDLRNAGHLEDIGGGAYITYLINNTPTSLHAEVYGRIVERAALRRKVLLAATNSAQLATAADIEVSEVIDRAVAGLMEIAELESDDDCRFIGEALADYVDSRFEYDDLPAGTLKGHSTGFKAFDNFVQGLKPDYLYTLSGITGLGKTSLVLHLARGIASQPPHPVVGSNLVVIFSTEMSTQRLARRILTSQLRINSTLVDDTPLPEMKWAIDELSRLPILLVNARNWTIERIMRKMEVIRRAHGDVGLIIGDYIGEMESAKYYDKRTDEVGHIIRTFKTMSGNTPGAKFQYGCPVIAVSQINRTTSLSGKPNMHGLAESAHIEHASDGIIFAYYDEDDEVDGNVITLEIQKHRDGRTGKCKVYYEKESYFWGDLA